jgi:hypothetical protein
MDYYCGDDFSLGQNLASEIRFLLRGFKFNNSYFFRCDSHQAARKKNRCFYLKFEVMRQGLQVS